MTLATFILAVIGTITATAALTWNILAFVWQDGRPKLTPVIGFQSHAGLVLIEATRNFRDVHESLMSAAQQTSPGGPLVIGVKVINAGREPFHVAEWELRSHPSNTSFKQFENPLDSPAVPCDIPPKASQTFFTDLRAAYALARASKTIFNEEPQRVVVAVSSGGRSYTTKPVEPAVIALGRPPS
jgi:hypothetical protein